MLQVELREGESGEALVNRFTKMIQKDGILREVKARRHFISAGERERIAQRKAAARRRSRCANDATRSNPLGADGGGPACHSVARTVSSARLSAGRGKPTRPWQV
jgi:ribosomal protein S21